jgi:HEAT repeat protein
VKKTGKGSETFFDGVVDRFILYDIGQLQGAEGQQAMMDLDRLGPNAIPALVRGVNKAACIGASCPISSLSMKLQEQLAASRDIELLAWVREEVGKGIGFTPHRMYLTGLQQYADRRVKKLQKMLKERVPQLIAGLGSKDAVLRRKAANTLASLGPDAGPAVAALLGALKDKDGEVRRYAARALAEVGPAAVEGLLAAARTAPEGQTRALACLALGESRPVAGGTADAVVEALKDTDPAVREAAGVALGHMGEAAVPALRGAVKQKEPGAALALGQVGSPGADAAVPDLVAALRGDSKELRVAAHHALVQIGPAAVPALVAALKGAEVREWYSITIALGKMGPRAAAAVPALTAALQHEEKSVRILAANALARVQPGNEAIRAVLGEAIPVLVEVLQGRDGTLRAWAAASLGSLGVGAASAVPLLTAALGDPDPDVRAAASDALSGVGHAAVPALVEALKDPSEEVRRGSVAALGRIGGIAVPALQAALYRPEAQVRCGAAASLAAVGPDAREAVAALVEVLGDRDGPARAGAAAALGAIRPETPAAARSLFEHGFDRDDAFRSACREALVQIGRGSAGPLAEALKDTSGEKRRLAAELLGKIGADAQAAVPALCGALTDGDAQVRMRAADALREVVAVPPDDKPEAAREAVAALVGALRDADPDVRIAAHLALIRLRAAAAPALGAALAAESVTVRRLAAETLKKLGPQARPAVPDLVAALADADAAVRDGAGWALQAIDPELRGALPALREALARPRAAEGRPARPRRELCFWSVGELAAAAGEGGESRKGALEELARRHGPEALTALALAAVDPDRALRQTGRGLLLRYFADRPDDAAEAEAARRLKLARHLMAEGHRDKAQDRLEDLVRTHPRTKAAEEGRGLLANMGL